MLEKIGNVVLNYEFYSGIDSYSDGDVAEEELLEICMDGRREEALYTGNKWTVLYHLSDIRGNIINWYPMDKDASVLEIGSGCGAISGFLCRKAKRVVGIELSKRRSMINAYRNRECDNLEIMVGNFKDIELSEKFDVITLIGVLEYAALYIGGKQPYVEFLRKIQSFLKPNGKIIIAIENKMGLKYFNGAAEDHVSRPFVGLEDYCGTNGVRTFSKQELIAVLHESGISNYKFYYPFPDYKLPDTIYSEERMPRVGEVRTWGTNYDRTRMGLFNEAIVSDQICRDGAFDYFANSFLVICNETDSIVKYAHYTNGRAKEYQTATVIKDVKGETIVQKAYLGECIRTYDIFANMDKYCKELQGQFPDIKYLQPTVEAGKLRYEYVQGDSLEQKLAKKLHDLDGLIEEFRNLFENTLSYDNPLMKDFEVTPEFQAFFGDVALSTNVKSLPITNVDMLLHNLIVQDNKYICIDYEWVLDFPVPFEFVKYRMATHFYSKYGMYLAKKISKEKFLESIGLLPADFAVYRKMEKKFGESVFGKNACYNYLRNYKKGIGMIDFFAK